MEINEKQNIIDCIGRKKYNEIITRVVGDEGIFIDWETKAATIVSDWIIDCSQENLSITLDSLQNYVKNYPYVFDDYIENCSLRSYCDHLENEIKNALIPFLSKNQPVNNKVFEDIVNDLIKTNQIPYGTDIENLFDSWLYLYFTLEEKKNENTTTKWLIKNNDNGTTESPEMIIMIPHSFLDFIKEKHVSEQENEVFNIELPVRKFIEMILIKHNTTLSENNYQMNLDM